MRDDRIEGFIIGSVKLTVASIGYSMSVTLEDRLKGPVEAVMSVQQSARLRRLLAAAERRARTPNQDTDNG
jgi:hypothetical protein